MRRTTDGQLFRLAALQNDRFSASIPVRFRLARLGNRIDGARRPAPCRPPRLAAAAEDSQSALTVGI